MIAGPSFEFRGLVASLVPEFGYAVAPGEEADLVGSLYAASAERLVREGVKLHLIGHFAADLETTAALVELGFGTVVREQLRDLSDVALEGAGQSAHRARLERVELLAYLIVGRCAGLGEGRLLEGTSTAQVRSAFTLPSARRRGIAAALLQHAIGWARAKGFERLFVEHETANLEGGAFWRRHFAPYLVFSMRYVDRTL